MNEFWDVKLLLVEYLQDFSAFFSVRQSEKNYFLDCLTVKIQGAASLLSIGIYSKTASPPRRYESVFQLLYTHTHTHMVSKSRRYSYQIYSEKSVCV